MKTSKYIVYCLLCVLATIAPPAVAQVYKWVDANGKIQYGDKAPDDKKSKVEEVKIAPTPPQSAPSSPGFSTRDHDFYNPKSPEKSGQERPAPKPQYVPPDKCQRARSLVQSIKEKRAYRSYGGDRVYLDEHELELFENDVKQYCR